MWAVKLRYPKHVTDGDKNERQQDTLLELEERPRWCCRRQLGGFNTKGASVYWRRTGSWKKSIQNANSEDSNFVIWYRVRLLGSSWDSIHMFPICFADKMIEAELESVTLLFMDWDSGSSFPVNRSGYEGFN